MQKVAIIGFGGEGLSAYRYFLQKGADITIFDENAKPAQPIPAGARFVSGKDCFKDLRGFDVVVRFPAVSPKRFKTDGEVTSVTKEFFKVCPAPIIGVTGSKGKGTTSSLIYHMLTNAGKKAHLVGNIGVPALNELPNISAEDVVVFELSSFQLWDMTLSPHVAVVLMVEQEHLDIHDDMQEYLDAKANIVRWQKSSDVTVYLPTNELTKKIALQGKGKKIPYTQTPGAHAEDNLFVMEGQTICPVTDLRLPGAHNVQNACAAITAAWQFTQNTAAIAKALREFEGLEHRLKFVREARGVKYYDDSFATTPTSAIAAIAAFDQPKVVILGGSDKGSDYTELSRAAAQASMRGIILIGLMRHKLKAALDAAGYTGELEMFDEHSDMSQIVQAAADRAQTGDVVVLSPACASFDMFKDYKDRGDKFIDAVQAL